MNHHRTCAAALAPMLLALAMPTHAQQATPSPAAAVPALYGVDTTPIGALLDDPRACAVLDKYIPGFSSNDQVDLARDLTLRGIQPYALDTMSDDVLAGIDAELRQLAP